MIFELSSSNSIKSGHRKQKSLNSLVPLKLDPRIKMDAGCSSFLVLATALSANACLIDVMGTERHLRELQSSLLVTDTMMTLWFCLLWKIDLIYSSQLLLKKSTYLVSNRKVQLTTNRRDLHF